MKDTDRIIDPHCVAFLRTPRTLNVTQADIMLIEQMLLVLATNPSLLEFIPILEFNAVLEHTGQQPVITIMEQITHV